MGFQCTDYEANMSCYEDDKEKHRTASSPQSLLVPSSNEIVAQIVQIAFHRVIVKGGFVQIAPSQEKSAFAVYLVCKTG